MAQTFTTEAVVRLRDEVTGALNALAANVARVNKKSAADAESTQRQAAAALNNSLKGANSELSRMSQMWREVGKEAAMAIAVFAGVGALRALKEAAVLQQQIVKAQMAGMSPVDAARLRTQAVRIAASDAGYGVSQARIMQTGVELRSIMTTAGEAESSLPVAVNTEKALDATGHHTEGLVNFFKSAEIMGLALKPEEFKDFANHFVKARQALSDTITPEGILRATRSSGVESKLMGKDFRDTIWMSLIQEMGDRAGTSLQMFNKQLTGGFAGTLHPAAKEFVRLGLARKEQFDEDKKGQILGLKPGEHIDGVTDWLQDPFKFVQTLTQKGGVFDSKANINEDAARKEIMADATREHRKLTADALDAEHIKARLQSDVIGEIRRLFPSGKAADALVTMYQQAEAFQNHANLIENAQGLDVDNLTSQDAIFALDALGNSVLDFGATLGQPIMGDAAKTMTTIGKSVAVWSMELETWQRAHPLAAKYAAAGAGLGALGLGGGAALLARNLMFGPLTAAIAANTAAVSANTVVQAEGAAATLTAGARSLTAMALRLGGALALPLALSGDVNNDPEKKAFDEANDPAHIFANMRRSPKHRGSQRADGTWFPTYSQEDFVRADRAGKPHQVYDPLDLWGADKRSLNDRRRDDMQGGDDRRERLRRDPPQAYAPLDVWTPDRRSLNDKRLGDQRGGDDRRERVKPDQITVAPVTVTGQVETNLKVDLLFGNVMAGIQTMIAKATANVSSLGPTMSGSNSPKNPTPIATPEFMGP